ncbi:hypothetical protein LIER_30417 [Lithospermum erythrorhizon]|uniref:Uncharacterized protein n=1 Tax=Lithospermum erythrorhizon TaxID=34254 RepID=A0AAV3RRK4_LITER
MADIFLLLLLTSCQTIMATKDWELNLSAKINGPTVDQVWPYLADYCNLYKIYPTDVTFCDKGTKVQPGLNRYSLTKSPTPSDPNSTVVFWVAEELLKISATEKYVTYEIQENNRGIDKLIATMQVLPSGDNGCKFKWTIVASPFGGLTHKVFVESFEGFLSSIVSLIENLF